MYGLPRARVIVLSSKYRLPQRRLLVPVDFLDNPQLSQSICMPCGSAIRMAKLMASQLPATCLMCNRCRVTTKPALARSKLSPWKEGKMTIAALIAQEKQRDASSLSFRFSGDEMVRHSKRTLKARIIKERIIQRRPTQTVSSSPQ